MDFILRKQKLFYRITFHNAMRTITSNSLSNPSEVPSGGLDRVM